MSDEKPEYGLVPSASTSVGMVGAFIAATIVFIFHFNGIDFPAGYEALMGGAITTAIVYLHNSGRRTRRPKP